MLGNYSCPFSLGKKMSKELVGAQAIAGLVGVRNSHDKPSADNAGFQG
jgi:hypothetical protein